MSESSLFSVQSLWSREHYPSILDRETAACRAAALHRLRAGVFRTGTLMAHRKLPEATVERLLKCQRWGVCDDGTADMCGVDLKTVHRVQRVAAIRAHEHHQHVVQRVDVAGVQMDEMHTKLRRKRAEWLFPALAMGSLFLLWVECGPRTQDAATRLIAQVIARVSTVPLVLPDGWNASTGARLPVLGRLYRPRRRGPVGRKPNARLVAPSTLFYAQLVKVRNHTGHVVEVTRRVVLGGPRRFVKQLRLRNLGETIQTACMERCMGPCGGWSPRCGAGPGVCRGAGPATRDGAGWW